MKGKTLKPQTCLRRLIRFANSFDIGVEFGTENVFYGKGRVVNRRHSLFKHAVIIDFSPRHLVQNTIDATCIRIGSDLAHELGHYLVAPQGRRNRRDYGIPKKIPIKSYDKWQLDDDKASMVEFQLLKHFRFDKRAIRSIRRMNPVAVAWWYETGKKMVSDVLKSTNARFDARRRYFARKRTAKRLAVKRNKAARARTPRVSSMPVIAPPKTVSAGRRTKAVAQARA